MFFGGVLDLIIEEINASRKASMPKNGKLIKAKEVTMTPRAMKIAA